MPYPDSVKTWTPKVDITDIVYAADVNELYTEVTLVETKLGLGITTSTWTGAFTQSTSWSTLAARLTNIERGLVTTDDVHTQYLKKDGSSGMAGNLLLGGFKIQNLGTPLVSTDAATKGYVDALGVYQDWTPVVTAAANPTTYTSTGRYTQIGKRVSGWGRIVGFGYAGSGNYQLSLPVTPASTSGFTRLGVAQLWSTLSGPNHGRHWQLELNSGKAQPIRETETSAEDGDTLVPFKYMTGGDVSIFVSSGTVYIEYQFDYEAA